MIILLCIIIIIINLRALTPINSLCQCWHSSTLLLQLQHQKNNYMINKPHPRVICYFNLLKVIDLAQHFNFVTFNSPSTKYLLIFFFYWTLNNILKNAENHRLLTYSVFTECMSDGYRIPAFFRTVFWVQQTKIHLRFWTMWE